MTKTMLYVAKDLRSIEVADYPTRAAMPDMIDVRFACGGQEERNGHTAATRPKVSASFRPSWRQNGTNGATAKPTAPTRPTTPMLTTRSLPPSSLVGDPVECFALTWERWLQIKGQVEAFKRRIGGSTPAAQAEEVARRFGKIEDWVSIEYAEKIAEAAEKLRAKVDSAARLF